MKKQCAVSIIALMVAFSGGSVLAQSTDHKTEINIKAQPLDRALSVLGQQFDVQIAIFSDDAANLNTKALEGQYTPEEALKLILKGSGLKFRHVNDRMIAVGSPERLAENIEVLQTIQQPQAPVKEATSSTLAINGSVSGHVSEINTGSNLAGALVRIIETGQTTKTDDLGNFRFPTVAPGNYTLSISYLGFASRITDISLGRGETFQEEYSLGKALGDLDEIVVFGSRSARAMALNLQRTASNSSDIISADDLGSFTGTSISEALRRVAGVSFVQDPNTGQGVNIIIRGLSPEMNAITLNGLKLPIGDGVGRAASLNNMLLDSIERITIHKSLLPSHDSEGTGGLVEIETKSPLNRPRRYVNFGVEGSRRGRDFGDDLLISGTVAGTFGEEDNFGLSASVQYRETKQKSLGHSTTRNHFGQYLPLDDQGGTSISQISGVFPTTPYPFEPGVTDAYPGGVDTSYSALELSNLSITLSAEWQIAEHTNFKFDMTNAKAISDTYSRGRTFLDGSGYTKRSVAALDGEERQALEWDGTGTVQQFFGISKGKKNITNTYSFQGNTSFDKWSFRYNLGYVKGTQVTPDAKNISLGFRDDAGEFSADYVLPSAVDPVENIILSLFPKFDGHSFLVPQLTDAGWDYINDPSHYNFQRGGYSDNQGKNDRYTASLSAQYEADLEHLKYVKVGVNFESARFSSMGNSSSVNTRKFIINPCCSLGFASLEDIGITSFEEADFSDIGVSSLRFKTVSQADLIAFFDRLPDLIAEPGNDINQSFSTQDPRRNEQTTKEDNLAAYLEARVDFGKLEIIGGFRMNRVKIHSRYLVKPSFTSVDGVSDPEYAEDFAQLRDESVVQTDILPRILFNYRQTDNLIFRGGYYLSVARPSIYQITGEQNVRLSLKPANSGPGQGLPTLSVVSGNPDLKPAVTHNFSFDIEYYDNDIGVIKFSAYYKHINNLIQANVTSGSSLLDGVILPDHEYFQGSPYFDPANPNQFHIEVTRPVNNPYSAYIWGLEAQIERQFTFLPGVWNGLGIYANINYTKSSKHYTYNFFTPGYRDPDTLEIIDGFYTAVEYSSVSFDGSPKYSGTVALTYNKHNIDATLGYSFQARRRDYFNSNSFHYHSEAVGTLDMKVEYRFQAGGGRYRLYFAGEDLLHGPEDVSTETSVGGDGNPIYYLRGNYNGGRILKLGINVTF